jgi:glycosyltransferase involved in cell wall biosynthesis
MARPPAVELAGYLGAAVGVGEAARRYVAALRGAGVPVLERDVPLPGRDGAGTAQTAGPKAAPEAITANLLCLNPEQMVPYLEGPEAPPVEGRVTVGIWSWEVDAIPPGWREASSWVSEVWTYSRFAAQRIEAGIGSPVLAIPPSIALGSEPVSLPQALPEGFRVLIMFDFLSTLQRKNPLGAIEAYRRAFAPEDGAVLVVKSVNGRHRPESLAEVTAALGGRPDITLIDRTLSGAERDALVAGCDCYLSLHRSEGHGMPLAEAMAMAKPVIATAYGGNTEFMSPANSYPIDWTSTLVGEGVEHYPAQASWAEPDIEAAVRRLREVHRDREGAKARALRGQADVRALLAPAAVGARMRERLEALERRAEATRGGLRSRLVWRLSASRGN